MKTMAPGKMAIADRGYKTSAIDEVGLFATPNKSDHEDIQQFIVRACMRHETFNGRIKQFKMLQDTFTYLIEKHKHVFEFVCVTVHYQMKNMSPLFEL